MPGNTAPYAYIHSRICDSKPFKFNRLIYLKERKSELLYIALPYDVFHKNEINMLKF